MISFVCKSPIPGIRQCPTFESCTVTGSMDLLVSNTDLGMTNFLGGGGETLFAKNLISELTDWIYQHSVMINLKKDFLLTETSNYGRQASTRRDQERTHRTSNG